MPNENRTNYAFIDAQNAYLGARGLGWKLNWERFFVYLRDKYQVQQAYYFTGYLERNKQMYSRLEAAGYTLIYKPVLVGRGGLVKGNCDAEMVLHAMLQLPNYRKAVVVSGDGDFSCLVQYLATQDKLEKLLVPDISRCSVLLRRAAPQGSLNSMAPQLKKFAQQLREQKREARVQDRTF